MNLLDLEELIPRQQNRKNIYNAFYKLFNSNDMLKFIEYHNLPVYTNEEIVKIILNLERGIFNSSLNQYNYSNNSENSWNDVFQGIYLNKALSIYLNLNPNTKLQNKNLLIQFLSKQLTEFEICKLEAKDLFPEKWKENMEKCGLLDNDNNINKNISLEERPDGILKCGKCKSWKTEYTERQTRSADEPTSKFCYCHNCGHRWRFC